MRVCIVLLFDLSFKPIIVYHTFNAIGAQRSVIFFSLKFISKMLKINLVYVVYYTTINKKYCLIKTSFVT